MLTDVVAADVKRNRLIDIIAGRERDRPTEGEIEFDSNVWLAWSAMENLTEHGIPIWPCENTPSSGFWLCE